jgi:hypothetical protein
MAEILEYRAGSANNQPPRRTHRTIWTCSIVSLAAMGVPAAMAAIGAANDMNLMWFGFLLISLVATMFALIAWLFQFITDAQGRRLTRTNVVSWCLLVLILPVAMASYAVCSYSSLGMKFEVTNRTGLPVTYQLRHGLWTSRGSVIAPGGRAASSIVVDGQPVLVLIDGVAFDQGYLDADSRPMGTWVCRRLSWDGQGLK